MKKHQSRKSLYTKIFFSFLLVMAIFFGKIIFDLIRYSPVIWNVVSKKEIQVKKTKQNRINLLLLGIGGGKHDGPLLTDTVIFASIDPETKKVTLVSLPRDLWVPEIKGKLNSAYAKGEEKRGGGGLLLTRAVVARIVGQPVDYAVRIDFTGFVKAVDMVGGLDITVDKTFDDYEYPVTGKENELCGLEETAVASLSAQIASGSASIRETFPCRFEHLHFEQGTTQVDGETALKYVRSRHGTNGEGSDFARSKRQEKVILAFKDKIFSLGTILNPLKVTSLYDTFKESIDMNIPEEEFDDFIRLAQRLQDATIKSYVIDFGDSGKNRPGLLTEPPVVSGTERPEYGRQYVLLPRVGSGNYTEIQTYVSCVIKQNNCTVTLNPATRQ